MILAIDTDSEEEIADVLHSVLAEVDHSPTDNHCQRYRAISKLLDKLHNNVTCISE
jgi:hypothetical protein